MNKIKVYMLNNNRESLTTRYPKWLYLTLVQLHNGVYNGNRFIPLTAIQQIDFEKGVVK